MFTFCEKYKIAYKVVGMQAAVGRAGRLLMPAIKPALLQRTVVIGPPRYPMSGMVRVVR